MSDPLDPFQSPFAAGEMLITGKQLYEAIIEQPHFSKVATVIDQLSAKDLRLLGFYVAAEQIAQRAERLGTLEPWLAWWGGLAGIGKDTATAVHTRPRELWKIIRPESDE